MEKLSIETVMSHIDATALKACEGTLYCYNEGKGVWDRIPQHNIPLCIRNMLPDELSNSVSQTHIREIASRLISNPRLQISPNQLNHDRLTLCVKNGVIRLPDSADKHIELLPHNPSFYHTVCLNFRYIKNRSERCCVNFNGFLKSSLNEDGNSIKQLYQVLGYTVSLLPLIRKAAFLIGPPGCGKSLIKELLQFVVGDGNYSCIPIHQLGSRFNSQKLLTQVNLHDELASSRLKNLEAFKSAVSGSTMMAEIKGGRVYELTPTAKHLYCGNILPEMGEYDGTTAVLDRMLFVIFSHSIDPDDFDFNLLEKLTNEVNSIFSKAVDKLPELIQSNYKFCEPELAVQFRNSYKMNFTILDDFVHDCFEFDSSLRVHSSTIVNYFKRYCMDNGLDSCLSKFQIMSWIQKLPSVVRAEKPFKINGSNSHKGFIGLALKKECDYDESN